MDEALRRYRKEKKDPISPHDTPDTFPFPEETVDETWMEDYREGVNLYGFL